MRRAYKFRAYPTRPQEVRAVRLLADHCDLYNAALEERREAWRMRKARVTYATQSAQLKDIRRADLNGQGRHSFTAQQQTLRTLQLKREHRRWYAIVVADSEPAPLPTAGRMIGADMGVVRFLTTSDGEIIPSPRFLKSSADQIADQQRRSDRACPGSANRRRLRRRLAREWRKVRNRRRDFHHKTARALVDTCDAVAVERLNVANMTRRPRSRPNPALPGAFLANGAARKAGLNTAILDAGWAQFTRILLGKAEEAGRRVILVNPAGTSTRCHLCGAQCARPRQDTVICPVHGRMDADCNAARNIYSRAGLGSGQAA